eukprot:TRINITY_DN8731_c1_g1_i1.p1 TRINITY_DN8731_c1_g1~~TRINITY_DN8731_c1_g1_i1.p1  ORF type:complete len:971 (+),score=320.27 TRINITY_DN8731_c1_g1_i1:87-2999(+)
MGVFKPAKRYAEARKWASLENKGGGELRLEVLGCSGLRKADSTGKADPFVRVLFSTVPENQQEAETDMCSQTLNPKWVKENRFTFNTVLPTDEVGFEVYDRDRFPRVTNKLMAKCKVQLGQANASGETSFNLHRHDAPDSLQHIDGAAADAGLGSITVKWQYSFSTAGTLFSSTDADPWVMEDFSMARLSQEVGRLSNHIYYMCVPYWYWMETCMWVRPFETAFWLALLYISVFVFENILSAFFPGLLAVSFIRTYWIRQRYGLDKQEETSTESKGLLAQYQDTKEQFKMVQNNAQWVSDMLDWWYEIYTWRKQDTAMALTKFFLGWTAAVLFFPWFPAFRYWFFAVMMYMYTLYPIYVYFPNIYRQYHEVALIGMIMNVISNVVNLRNCEKYIWPLLPRALVALIPPSQEKAIQDSLSDDLPPIPQHAMSYGDWRRFNERYEERKKMIELKRRAQLSSGLRPRSSSIDLRQVLNQIGQVKGVLHVHILSGRDLAGRDSSGLCDPYVVLRTSVGHEKRTKEVKQTVRPVWKNERFLLRELNYRSGYLMLSVRDHNSMSDDLSLGVGRVDLSLLAKGEEEELRVPLRGTEKFGRSGSEIVLRVLPEEGWPTPDQRELLRTERRMREAAKPAAIQSTPPDTRTGVLTVTVLDGTDLKVCDSKSSDPFMLVSVRGVSGPPKRTRTIKSSINPVFNQPFEFSGVGARMGVHVECFDHDKVGSSDPMGSGEVPDLTYLFEDEPEEVSVPLRLKGRQYGSVQLLLVARGFGRPDPRPEIKIPDIAPPAAAAAPPPAPVPPPAAPPTPPRADPPPITSPTMASPQAATPGPDPDEAGHSGWLRVTVIGARGLMPLPASPQPEPYVKFRLLCPSGDSSQKFKTRPCAAGTLDPVWHVTYTFQRLPPDALRTSKLQIEVWDARCPQEALAAGVSPLDAVAEYGEQLESWVTVYRYDPVTGSPDAAGEVRVILAPSAGLM